MGFLKRSALFCTIILLLIVGNYACTTTKKTETDVKLENALLWKITGPGIKSPSYLYGTIHIINQEDYFLPKGTLTAFEEVKKVVFEIDMKEMSDISAIMGMMNKIFMKDNMTLKDLISPEDYALVGNHFQKMGIPIFMLERMKPMFLTVFAYSDMDHQGLKNGNMKSYEMEFMEMAQQTGKETGGLETIDFQISLFDEIPYDAQAKMLVDAIKSSGDNSNDEFKKMTRMYLNQDINSMVSMISEEGSDVAGFEDKLLNERNRNWISGILDGAKKEPTFFAVGAGHLGGTNGVIRLLRKAGLKVTPVR